MRKLKRIILILVGAVVLLIVVVILGRNMIIKSSVPPAVKKITGFEASIGDIDVGLLSSKVGLKDLKVMNPSDFGEKMMLDAPEIYVEYKLPTMMSQRREFPVIRLNIQQVVVVKNEKGESNVARIMEFKPKSEGPSAENFFGTLDLTLGTVRYVDYSKMHDGKPFTKDLTLNFHRTYHDLLDSDLKKVVMFETLKMLPVKLGDITPESIQKQLGSVTGIGLGLATNVTGKAVETFKGLGGLFGSKTNKNTSSK